MHEAPIYISHHVAIYTSYLYIYINKITPTWYMNLLKASPCTFPPLPFATHLIHEAPQSLALHFPPLAICHPPDTWSSSKPRPALSPPCHLPPTWYIKLLKASPCTFPPLPLATRSAHFTRWRTDTTRPETSVTCSFCDNKKELWHFSHKTTKT